MDHNPFKEHSENGPYQDFDLSTGWEASSAAGLKIIRREENNLFKNTNYNFKISTKKQNTINSKEDSMNGVN